MKLRDAMTRASFVLLVWACNLAVLWVISWAIFDPDLETVVMLAGASATVVVFAAWTLIRERRAGMPGDTSLGAVPDSSQSTALAGVAIIGLMLAAEFGPWLAYLSGGALVLAIAGLGRERRAARAMLDAARRADKDPTGAVATSEREPA